MLSKIFSYRFLPIHGFVIGCFLLCLVALSCQKKGVEVPPVIEEQFKDMLHRGGISGNIKIQASQWYVDHVKLERGGEILKDSTGATLQVNSTDTVTNSDGWLRLAKTAGSDSLFLDLKENFSLLDRTLIIVLNADGQKTEMRIQQYRATSYKIIDTKVTEIDSLRMVYTNDSEIKKYTFNNNTSVAQTISDENVFGNIQYYSKFVGDDMDAFHWISQKDSITIPGNDLVIDGTILWIGRVDYKLGTTFTPYQRNAVVQTTVPPYTAITLSGTVKYIERVSRYTLTIQNEQNLNRFDVSGIWRQRIPVSTTLLREQKPST